MSVCAFAALLYFLFPPQVPCDPYSSEWAWSAWSSGYKSKLAEIAEEEEYLKWKRKVESLLQAPYQHCRISADDRVQLTPREKCFTNALAKRCNEADDCLMQCNAKGLNRGGDGCGHYCFNSKFDLPSWRPPKGYNDCARVADGQSRR